MNEIIRKRKSVRKYDPAKLDAEALGKVRSQIGGLTPLTPGIRFAIEISDMPLGGPAVKAPHYLLFYSEDKAGAYENIGFLGQCMSLYFSASGLGSCWLGMAKPAEKTLKDKETGAPLQFVICMAFGKPAEPLFREASEFKRKPLAAISEGADARLEAARLAPSGINLQFWYFIADGEKIHCYIKPPVALLGPVFKKMNRIDMGIALCHIAQESKNFKYVNDVHVPFRKNCVYVGSVV